MAPNKSKTPADTRVASDKMTPAKKLKFDEKTWSETQTPSCSWNSVRHLDSRPFPLAQPRPFCHSFLTPPTPPTAIGGLSVAI